MRTVIHGARPPSMQPVTIYTTAWCPYCSAAKSLLKQKGAAFTEIDVERTQGARAAMVQRAGGRTSVPQIFVGDTHVGGCDDLYALDRSGGLDPLLATAGNATADKATAGKADA